MPNAETDWLVELTPIIRGIAEEDLAVVEVVSATCFDEAVFNAFFTRNIASDWIVTEVEEA